MWSIIPSCARCTARWSGAFPVSFLPADRKGCIDYADFDRLLQTNTKAVICTAGSNLTGNLLDLTRIGAFCAAHGLLFVVDASQTAGVFPIDLRAQHISVLCFTGHKSLMGPQGTGGLCVAEGVDIRPWCVGGTGVQTFLPSQPPQYPTRLEAGTRNGHGIAGCLPPCILFRRRAWMPSARTSLRWPAGFTRA
ncbi:MAG: aminotransferase class V-fold PLP-dependent enzyme [Ruminococcus sp.]